MKRLMQASLLFGLLWLNHPLLGQSTSLTATTKKQVIAALSQSLRQTYVDADTARRMSQWLIQRLKAGAYDTIRSPAVFAARLTQDLSSIYADGHLSVAYDPAFLVAQEPDPTTLQQQTARQAAFRRRVNFGFNKVEILPGNIGYLKLDGFFAPDADAKQMAVAALRLIGNSETLILDLRTNRGGDPDMVTYLCSFFFEQRTHLNDLYSRKDNTRRTYWTTPDTLLPRLRSLPIYVLTSTHTFSAGEELAYDLQAQHRALIVGETTGGGAHPVAGVGVGAGLVAYIPFARAINPITRTNWEKVGVKPDLVTPADQALDAALRQIKPK